MNQLTKIGDTTGRKYHCYEARTSDGLQKAVGYREGQIMKFLCAPPPALTNNEAGEQIYVGFAGDWFLSENALGKWERRLNPDGTPVTVTVFHRHVKFRREADAKKHGFEMLNDDETEGPIVEEPEWVKTYEAYDSKDALMEYYAHHHGEKRKHVHAFKIRLVTPETQAENAQAIRDRAKILREEADRLEGTATKPPHIPAVDTPLSEVAESINGKVPKGAAGLGSAKIVEKVF